MSEEIHFEDTPLQTQIPQDPEAAPVPPLDLAPTNKEWVFVLKWTSLLSLVVALVTLAILAWIFGYLSAPKSALVYKMPPLNLSNAIEVRIYSQGHYELKSSEILKDCHQHLKSKMGSGIYKINPDGGIPFFVFCEQNEDEGGWIVVQRRSPTGSSYNRKPISFSDYTYYDYEYGFGNLLENHWLGLGYLHRIAPNISSSMVMKIIVRGAIVAELDYKETYTGRRWEGYYGFWVDKKESGFKLHLRNTLVFGNLTDSNKEDSWKNVDNGRPFLARDAQGGGFNWCAEQLGGWWHHPVECSPLSLNADSQKMARHQKERMFGWRNSTHRIVAPLETFLLVRPQYHFPYLQTSQ